MPIPSPCGPNCTYTYEFEGPSFKCSEEIVNFTTTYDDLGKEYVIYSASWYYFNDGHDGLGLLDSDPKPALLNISTINIPQIPYLNGDLGPENATVLVTGTNLSCVPYRSQYRITNSYTNSIQTLNYSVTEIEPIRNLQGRPGEINITGLVAGNTIIPGDNMLPEDDRWLGGIQWTNESLSWFRDSQLVAIVSGMATALNGTCFTTQDCTCTGNLTDDTEVSVYWSSITLQTTGSGGPLVPFSRFSSTFENYTFPVNTNFDPPISFTVSEASLNKALGDFVVSIIPAFAAWNQSVPVTRFPSHNVYWFSSPRQLLIPYGVSLLMSLIVIILGIQALHQNGIPATDGGFIQVLSTTTGSARLRKAAAGNCLGGDGDNLTKQLKGTKIRFGELVDMQVEVDGHLVRRAGFGVDDEIIPLIKGGKYGVVHG